MGPSSKAASFFFGGAVLLASENLQADGVQDFYSILSMLGMLLGLEGGKNHPIWAGH